MISKHHAGYRGTGPNKFLDLTGKRSGKLVAQWTAGRHTTPNGTPFIYWLCLCDCGNTKLVAAINFKRTYSCTCARSSCGGKTRNPDGSHPPEYRMWATAKHRAKIKQIPFNIRLADIVIPSRCPLLDIPLQVAGKRLNFNSPTLDRKIPSLGYVTGNIQVLSFKANMAKSVLSLSEMQLLVRNWEKNQCQ